MHNLLLVALQPVLRDARATGVPAPTVRDEEWAERPVTASAYLDSPDGSSAGVQVALDNSEADRVVEVAAQVQEVIIEDLWPDLPTNWPPCPHHPDSHPLSASNRNGTATWTCPTDHTPVCAVGDLA